MTGKSRKIALLTLTLLFVLIGGVWYLYYREPSRSKVPEQLNYAVKAALQGDPVAAARQAQEYLQGKDSRDQYYILAMAVRANSLTDAATTNDKMVEAVRAIKESFNAAPPNSFARASAVNTLLIALRRFKSQSASDEAYKDEPFKSLRVKGDNVGSERKLAAYSISTYETADGYLYLGLADADTITSALLVDGTDTRSLKGNAAKIIDSIQKADPLIMKNKPSRYFLYSSYQWQLYWKAYDLGVAALVDARYLPQAEDAFKKAIDYATTTRDLAGNKVYNVQAMGTVAHLQYASMLYRTLGDKRSSDIRENLRGFLQDIQSNSSQNSSYSNLFNSTRSASSTGTTTAQKRLHKLNLLYSGFSKISPEFKAFLISSGWKF